MTVEWSDEALADIEGAAEWLEARNPRAARELVVRILAMAASLDAGRIDGREVIIDDGRKVCRWPVESLVIYYRRKDTVLEVLRVYDGRRKPIEQG